ncbi:MULTISPECIES: GerAB/ArcD/ProY family transporter [Clostridium]|uniref:GerAB/ArcD/ProY family transporter n=1 Tax=Clostridium TaxID=1485 RepID=UPI000825D721|nr:MULTISPECIES: GerAB/ArcD/ProY family transporter [Clostridium]PJI10433.1 spore gernimation protein [Clostridium sp. CT7]
MKTKISVFQLFASIVMFESGTAVFFYLASDTKQDAWITILIYVLPAIILQIIYTSLWKDYPQDNVMTYMPKIFGKFIGYFLSVIYIIYFIYGASRVLRDLSELMSIAVLPKIPLILTSFMLIIITCYAVFSGIESICRIAATFLFVFLCFFILSFIFLSTTPDVFRIRNLKPVIHSGLLFLIKKGWTLMTFPFGESLVFSTLYPFVVESKKVRKYAIAANILEGIILSSTSIMVVSTLGVKLAQTSLFPLLQTFRVIKVGSAFDRLDILVVVILLFGVFFKMSFFIYAAMVGTASLIKFNNIKYLSIPISIIVLIASEFIAQNYPQHIKIGLDFTVKYIHVPMLLIIPILALIVVNLKKLKERKKVRMQKRN